MFSFRNMQTFIRNCIEPHTTALNYHLKTNRIWTQTEIDELKKSMQKQIDELIIKTNKQLEDQNISITTKIENLSTIEIGWIGTWPVSAAPKDIDKWLKCDGDIFNTTKYKDLATLLQSNTTPDYRGYFLRGVGGNSAALNVHQGDRIRNITGYLSGHCFGWGGGSASGAFTGGSSGDRPSSGGGGTSGNAYWLDVSRQVPTGPENNPVNKAVQFWIRALL